MPINLQEIRTAVRDYLDTKVTLAISSPTPSRGLTINQVEDFTFSVTASNSPTHLGGIALKNVCYHLRIINPTVAALIVPPAPMVARSGLISADPELTPVLAPGTEVVEMYLFPADERNRLSPGESDTISELRGRTRSGSSGRSTVIELYIMAEVDIDYLFPRNMSPTASRAINVV